MLQGFYSSFKRRSTSTQPSSRGAVLALLVLLVLLSSSVFILRPPSAQAQRRQDQSVGSQNSALVQTRALDGSVMRQDVFARGTDQTLLHRWKLASSVTWSPWESLGHHLDSAPTVVVDPFLWPQDTIDVFFLEGNHIMVTTYNPSQATQSEVDLGVSCAEHSFGGFCVTAFTSAPAVITWGGHEEVFAFAGSHTLMHKWAELGRAWSDSDWETLSVADFADDPAAVSWGAGRIDVFVHGADDNNLHQKTYDGSWHDWQNLGGTLTSSPAAISTQPETLRVLARDANNGISSILFSNGSWGPWNIVTQGEISAAPAATPSISGGLFDLYIRNADGFLWLDKVSAGGIEVQLLGGGVITSAPAAVVTSQLVSTPPLPTPVPTLPPPTPTPTPFPHRCLHPPCPSDP